MNKKLNLEEIEARVNAATPGPWEYFSSVDQRRFGIGLGLSADISFGPDDVHLKERPRLKYALEFIAHARADIPALIADLRAAREALRIAADRLEGVSIAIEKHGQDITPSFFIVEYSKYAIEARKALSSSVGSDGEGEE